MLHTHIHTDTRYARSPHYIPSVGGINFPFSAMCSAVIRTVYTWLGFGYRYKGDLLGETQWLWLEDILKAQNATQHMYHSLHGGEHGAHTNEKGLGHEEGAGASTSKDKQSVPSKFNMEENRPDYTVIVSSIQGMSTNRVCTYAARVFECICFVKAVVYASHVFASDIFFPIQCSQQIPR